MSRPTIEDYNKLIGLLVEGREQIQPDGDPCRVCGDNGHQAFECHHNPAFVMKWKESLEEAASKLHDTLHAREHMTQWSEEKEACHELLHHIIGVYRR